MGDVAMIPATHGRHDRLLVAAQADRPVDRDGGTALGRALLAACVECARLHAELVALATALPTMATPRRTRDFTLSAADAERLRPRGLRRWLGLVGSSRDVLSRPLAIGFTTLGLVGLLLTTAPSVLPLAGGSAATPLPTDATRLEMAPAASADGGFQQGTGSGSQTTGEAPLPVPPTVEPTVADDSARLPVVVLSSAFLVVGGGLFVVRRRTVMR